MPHTKTLKLQENFAYRNENTNPKIQVPIKNVENINLLSPKKKREREKPGTSSIGKVRVRLVVDDVVVFFEVRRLNVVHDLKNWV